MSAELYAALAQAQATAGAVGKSARNEHHKYSYASSEAIIGEARDALSACGLALLCVDASLVSLCDVETVDQDGVARRSTQWQASLAYLLVHSSGGSMPIVSSTPVLPEKGRPLDKALATAKTYDLAYTLRSLLLLPRVDPRELAEEPVDQRRETPVQGGGDIDRLLAGFAACTDAAGLADLTRRASVLLRDYPREAPERARAREALAAAQARVGA